MIIKKFQAYSEKDAILQAKDEMGNDAIVLNIKTIKHRGFARLFKKEVFEVTAALEEKISVEKRQDKQLINGVDNNNTNYVSPLLSSENTSNSIEEKLNNLQKILENQIDKNSDSAKSELKNSDGDIEENVNQAFMKLIYNKLNDNEVDDEYASEIIAEVESSLKKESSLDTILSGIYQKIILKLGQPEVIELKENTAELVFFVGPTGVGKTTTIAKLASHFKLEKKVKVAMITSDTYRIAAVEQLRTYANILDIPLQVVYTLDEFNEAVKSYKDFDIIFVDTAGRSHKNIEQCREMMHLVNDSLIDEEYINKKVYLVLSAATKYKDLVKITEAYNEIKNYSLIFTKLDETLCLGNILNIKLRTCSPLSYVTSGQVVPDDISRINPQKIAKLLLGGGE